VARGVAAQRGGFSSGVFAQSLKVGVVNRMFVVVFRPLRRFNVSYELYVPNCHIVKDGGWTKMSRRRSTRGT
jgi:hypothetical protein